MQGAFFVQKTKERWCEMAHKHDVYDTDKRFVINPLTWEITNPSNRKIKLAKDDHNSKRITFEIPRIVTDGHDVSLCNKIEIHYIKKDENLNNSSSLYIFRRIPEAVIRNPPLLLASLNSRCSRI